MQTYAHAHAHTQSLPHFIATISTILITITCRASPLGLDNRHSHHSMVTVTLLRTQCTPSSSLIKPDNGFYKFAKAFTRHDVQQQVSGHVDDLPLSPSHSRSRRFSTRYSSSCCAIALSCQTRTTTLPPPHAHAPNLSAFIRVGRLMETRGCARASGAGGRGSELL